MASLVHSIFGTCRTRCRSQPRAATNVCVQNHSCDPNCAIIAVYINEANIEKPLLAIFTQRDVEPYEEICFSYMGNVDDSDLDSDSDDDVRVLSVCRMSASAERSYRALPRRTTVVSTFAANAAPPTVVARCGSSPPQRTHYSRLHDDPSYRHTYPASIYHLTLWLSFIRKMLWTIACTQEQSQEADK